MLTAMIQFRLLLPAILCLISNIALAVQDCELNGASVNPANGYTTEGKSGIMRCRDRDSGQLQREQELRQGKFVGVVRYFKDGRLEKEFSVNEQGNREGRSREYSTATGKVIRDETLRNGSTIGLGRSYYAEGPLKRISVRDEGGKELAVAEFTERGQLRDLRCGEKPVLGKEVDEAALCGFGQRGKPALAILYNDRGDPRGRLTHLDGVRIGSESYWDNGKLRSQEETGADGGQIERSFGQDGVKRREIRWIKAERGRAKDYEQEFHDSGALTVERRWHGGELSVEKSFYLNGQPRSEMRYFKRDGSGSFELKEFHDNGKLAFEGRYVQEDRYRQLAVGDHRGYDAEGRQKWERSYDGKGRLTREKEFNDKGQMTRDDAVFEDGSRKAYLTGTGPAR